MLFELRIDEQDYVLFRVEGGQRNELARVSGGGSYLLKGSGPPTELQLETAIQMAEDWLMPHASGLHGHVVVMEDLTGRMASGLQALLGIAEDQWSLQEWEQVFLKVVDLATGRHPPALLHEHRLFVADLVLVRELAHHGQVARVKLSGP